MARPPTIAKARAIVRDGRVAEVILDDRGKGYDLTLCVPSSGASRDAPPTYVSSAGVITIEPPRSMPYGSLRRGRLDDGRPIVARTARARLTLELEVEGFDVVDGGSGYSSDEVIPAVTLCCQAGADADAAAPKEAAASDAKAETVDAVGDAAVSVAVVAKLSARPNQKAVDDAVAYGMGLVNKGAALSLSQSNVELLPPALLPVRDLQPTRLDAAAAPAPPASKKGFRGFKTAATSSASSAAKEPPPPPPPPAASPGRYYQMPIPSSLSGGARLYGDRAAKPVEITPPLALDNRLRFFVSGGICSSIAHTALVPVDVLKTRMQTSDGAGKGPLELTDQLLKTEGLSAFTAGLGVTFVGYTVAGALAFGCTESFVRVLQQAVGPANSLLFATPLLGLASALAVTVCTFAVCPFETVRIRTVAAGGEGPSATGLGAAKEILEEGSSFFTALPPILLKEVRLAARASRAQTSLANPTQPNPAQA